MRPKSKYNRRLLCETLEPRAMLSGTGVFRSILTNRLDRFNVVAGVMGPVNQEATATASKPFAGVNVGIGLQAQAAATASSFLAGISNNASAQNSSILGPPDPFTTPSPGLATPFQIGLASPVTSAVIPITNTLSPLVNTVSSLTNTLNAITSNTSSGLGNNTFNTASNTLNVLTDTLNALVNATLFSDISSFLGSATAIVQVNPGTSTIATPFVPANSAIFTAGTPFAPANSGVNATVAIVLSTLLAAQTAVNNAVAQTTGPIAPLVDQVLASSQSLVNNLTLQSSDNSGLFQPPGITAAMTI